MSEVFKVIEFPGDSDREALRALLAYLEESDDRVLIGAWNIPGDTDTMAIQAVITMDTPEDGKPQFYPGMAISDAIRIIAAEHGLDDEVGTYEVGRE